ncbi:MULTISPECIES: GNAT family N-acetyltransferase [Providencia]|uniref:GNAT family N-acetyltransferase n=1 Tax=Providencia alcalifaciens TaxID=126385 RepID=A0AAW9VER7_9GAMM|nr:MULTISPECIES: GNAT family N-acetyltransferase [Providencia]EKT65658.1 acyl-CoA N-acyltransferase [Providencia alcalifaciens Dmel2]ETT05885.1 FR47-like protein [Providencia alcalifaciens F90-2004]EUC94084.1 FR47-like protein [Providencia alcalifaciens PAL-2]EUD04279.1 FR47-like protein [Providencia alcalifaciens RIMD 1656011]EUD08494.1 FR47-like protein [Providencia alcalifaciens R90-1475]
MIRTAKKEDLSAILSLYQILFAEMAKLDSERLQDAEQSNEFVENAINDTKFHLLVVDHEGEIKGFCIAQKQTSDPYSCIVPRDFGYIFDLIVSPDFRGERAGKQLLDGMKEWAKKQKFSHLELSVLAQNHQAIKFYEREGLTEVSRTMGISL